MQFIRVECAMQIINKQQRIMNLKKSEFAKACFSSQSANEEALPNHKKSLVIKKSLPQHLSSHCSNQKNSKSGNTKKSGTKNQNSSCQLPKESNFSTVIAHTHEDSYFTEHKQVKSRKQPNENQSTCSFLRKDQFQICPELYSLWRTEKLVQWIRGDQFQLRQYSKGRQQIKYLDGTVQVTFNDLKLTRWANGDFKLVDGDKVSFWSEQLAELDQFYNS